MSSLTVDLDLVRKYNVAAPRYTSYPPATKFTNALGWPELADKILENNREDRSLSLYFHIPFCESLCWYCGCTTVITRQHSQAKAYLANLAKEVDRMKTLINPRRPVVQLHWGGGSPTFLQPDEIRALGNMIRRNFPIATDAEASVEVDPRRLTREHLVALCEVGFNRLSIGVQDFDPKVQAAIHRIQPRELTEQTVRWARELGFVSLNFDLIYGLPHQTIASFDQTLDAVLDMAPNRLAVFSYAHVPWLKPAQKMLEREVLPLPELKLSLFKHIVERLTAGGCYEYIGMDHFAAPDDELAIAQQEKNLQRNFQGYSTHRDTDIYAFGMSSVSQIPDAYWQNAKHLPTYYSKLDAGGLPITGGYLLSEDDKIRREIIMRIMCDLSVDFDALSEMFGVDLESYFETEFLAFSDFEADGLVRATREGFDVTHAGRLFLRNLAMCFDNTLIPAGHRRHSRTI